MISFQHPSFLDAGCRHWWHVCSCSKLWKSLWWGKETSASGKVCQDPLICGDGSLRDLRDQHSCLLPGRNHRYSSSPLLLSVLLCGHHGHLHLHPHLLHCLHGDWSAENWRTPRRMFVLLPPRWFLVGLNDLIISRPVIGHLLPFPCSHWSKMSNQSFLILGHRMSSLGPTGWISFWSNLPIFPLIEQ